MAGVEGSPGGMSSSGSSPVKLKNNLPPFSLAERNKSMYKNSTRYLWNLSDGTELCVCCGGPSQVHSF